MVGGLFGRPTVPEVMDRRSKDFSGDVGFIATGAMLGRVPLFQRDSPFKVPITSMAMILVEGHKIIS
jgi:hypothetical protein